MTDYRDARVLVTGGAGFIGSHLADALAAAGAHVTILDNLQAGTWVNVAGTRGARLMQGDVRRSADVASALEDGAPDFVFHLAANASVPGSVGDPRYDFESNCAGTFEVLEGVRTRAPKARVVLASSAAVYGEPRTFPMLETSPVAPISPYGASKAAAELETRMFHDVYGLDVVIARIFNTYGPRMARFVVLDFLRKLERDESVLEILGDGRQVRDFTYVSDTVAGLMVCGSAGAVGEAYNLASGVSHSVTDLATRLLRVLGLSEKTKLTFTGASWVGDAQRWEVSVEKLKAIGYQPRVDLDEGLRGVLAWFRETR